MNTGLPPESWDTQLQKLNGHFLQSRPWAQFQMAIDREIVWDQADDWMWLAAVRGRKGLKYLLCSYGPAAPDSKKALEALQSLQDAAKRLGCDFVRVEPRNALNGTKMRQMDGRMIGEVQPAHTQVVDLAQSVDELRKRLASGHRNLINGTKRRGVVINQSANNHDFREFLAMMGDTATRARVTFFPHWYYEGLWKSLQPAGTMKLYIASVEVKDERLKMKDQLLSGIGGQGEPKPAILNSQFSIHGKSVAAALFYDWNDTRIYAHAGAYQELNRKANASVSLVWQAMMDAKDAGMTKFDLWGVAPDGDLTHKWAGITKFKKGFGGQQVDYVGTWDIPINKQKYRLYSVYRKLKGQE